MWVFLSIKYTKFWSASLEHFVERKPLISEECYLPNEWNQTLCVGGWGWGSEAVCSDKISHLHKMRSSLAQSFNGTRTSIYSARSSNQVMVSCTGIKMEWLPLALLHKSPCELKGDQNSSSARLLVVASKIKAVKDPAWRLVDGFLVLLIFLGEKKRPGGRA